MNKEEYEARLLTDPVFAREQLEMRLIKDTYPNFTLWSHLGTGVYCLFRALEPDPESGDVMHRYEYARCWVRTVENKDVVIIGDWGSEEPTS